MPAQTKEPIPYRLAICREDRQDEKEWSLYLLNELHSPIDVPLKRVSYEWGDRAHSVAPDANEHSR